MSKKMSYAGLRSARSWYRYRGAKFSVFFGRRVRQLSEPEIAEFKAGIQRALERRS